MQPTTVKFGKFVVQLGTGTGTITYTAPCGFTSKALQFSKDLNDVQIPDCDDPDAVAWLGRDVASLSAQVTGEGVLAQESVVAWLAAVDSVNSVPVKVILTFPARTITWTGYMHISEFNIQAELGNRVTVSVTMNSDGPLTRTMVPAS